MSEKRFIVMASDGSAIRKPKKRGSKEERFWCSGGFSGRILDSKGKEKKRLSGVVQLDDSTNNIGELTGLEMAIDEVIELVKDEDRVIFLLDSEYTRKSVTEWIYNWMRNERDGVAYTSTKQPVKNYEQIKRIHNKLNKIANKEVLKIRSHVADGDIEKKWAEFCHVNDMDIKLETWKYFSKLNNECDAIVNTAATKLKEGKRFEE